MQLIRKKDNLSTLTDWKKNLTCASILSSPVFRRTVDRLEFSPTRMERNSEKLDYVPKKLLFSATYQHYDYKWTSDCILCRGYTDDDEEFPESTNLYLTPSFDDKKSLYLLKEDFGLIYLSKYFVDVPILKNVQETVTENVLFKNYNYY